MKPLFLLATLSLTLATAQAQRWIIPGQNGPDARAVAAEKELKDRQARKKAADAKAAAEAARQAQRTADMTAALHDRVFRLIGGVTNSVFSEGWYNFSGRIEQVHADGIRIAGSYSSLDGLDSFRGDFFVIRFPFEVADGDTLSAREYHMAKAAGTYRYPTAAGSFRTLRKLDYGLIIAPPPPSPAALAERDAAKAAVQSAAAEKAAKQAAAVFEFYRAQAEGGDASAQFRLGQLYRDGRGVGRDLAKARLWFQKAAAQGHKDATAALADPQQ